MALRAVADHPKLSRLKAILKCGRGEAMGYLEAMWHFAGRYTPQGNIGKYSDEEIEAWIEWRGDNRALVAALIESGWLDTDDAHRLVIHDWAQNADELVNTELARKCLRFVDGSIPKSGRLNKSERENFSRWVGESEGEARRPGRPTKNQPKPRQSDLSLTETANSSAEKPRFSAETPKPEPEPVPEPEPEPEEMQHTAPQSKFRPPNALDCEVPPDDWNHLQCAAWFWDRLSIMPDRQSNEVCAENLRLYARERRLPVTTVCVEVLARAKLDLDHGETINRFWFTDGHHKPKKGGTSGGRTGYDERTKAQRDQDATVDAVSGAKEILRRMVDRPTGNAGG